MTTAYITTTKHRIKIPVLLEEIANDVITATEHPIETGASVTDHAYKNPVELIMRCGWSNSGLGAAVGAVGGLLTGNLPGGSFVNTIYEELRLLQTNREILEVQTSRRLYANMLITGLALTTDHKTSSVLLITITFRQLIIVSTKSVSSVKADPTNGPDTQETAVLGTIRPSEVTTVSLLPGE